MLSKQLRCSIHMLDWNLVLGVEFLFRWCFGDVPFSTHVLRRFVNSGHIGSFHGVDYGPGNGR